MTTWLPLESNPEVLNKYIYDLGVSKKWSVVDVICLDPEVLEYIPKPVKAVIFLAPCSDAYEKHCKEVELLLKEKPTEYPKDMFFMKQTVHNACGTIALVHSIANCPTIEIGDGILKNYLDKAKDLSVEDRGKELENDSAFTTQHQELALEGQTVANPEEKVNHHFIALIEKEGVLYELDGRKSFPVDHGPTSPETFLVDATKICKKYMLRDPDEVRFTILAVTATQE